MTATANTPATVRVEIPFCGFDESAGSAALENALDSEVEYLATGGAWPLDKEHALEKIRPLISEDTFSALRPLALQDWEAYDDFLRDKAGEFVTQESEISARRKVAEDWALTFCERFSHEYGIDLDFDLSSLLIVSPPYYNFESDRLFCRASLDGLKTLFEENRAAVAAYARNVLTPRDGFLPFHSPDVEDWGPCEDWDAAQWGLVLEALETESVKDALMWSVLECEPFPEIDYEGLFRAVLSELQNGETGKAA